LSGGQKQRVALGRALIIESDLFLLDEPLAHLDAKIRNELRAEFQNIKSFLSNSTVVYVTHDYMEAMALGDRMCVIRSGEVMQIDEPKKVYNQPRNIFVAELLGHPTINLIEGELRRKNDGIRVVRGGFSVKIPKTLAPILRSYKKDIVVLGLRPKDVLYELKKPKKPGDFQKATIRAYEIRNYRGVILAEVDKVAVTIHCAGYEKVEEGKEIWLRPDTAKMYLFDAETRENLVRYST
jgi:multiple sugar transport system ATP-binding protein